MTWDPIVAATGAALCAVVLLLLLRWLMYDEEALC